MYDQQMPKLRKHALRSADGLVDIITFTLLTIQQPLQGVGKCFADVKEKGATSAYLFGSKRPGYQYAVEHKESLYEAVKAAVATDDTIAAIDALAAIPGLGIVKAAFVAQMCGFDVACIDRHNLARLGLKEDTFKTPKTLKPATRRAKIARYVEITRETGGSREWWNSWCEYVAGRRGSPLKTAEEVSAYHCIAIGLPA